MTSATERAYDQIKAAIKSGELAGGDPIRESWVAEKIGVSRTPIRHALQKLAAEGFVDMHHHHSARVVQWDEQESEEIRAMRAMLESFAAGLAAQKIRASKLEVLHQLADEMEAAVQSAIRTDLEAITELNIRFHNVIVEAADNRYLATIAANLAHPLLVQRSFRAYNPVQLKRSMQHHREIIDALTHGDSDWASAAMRSHILASTGGE